MNFKKIIDLLRERGERCLIVTEKGEPLGFFEPIVGDCDSFEDVHDLDLTGEGDLDSINRDIALSQEVEENEVKDLFNNDVEPQIIPPNQPLNNGAETEEEDERYYVEPLP